MRNKIIRKMLGLLYYINMALKVLFLLIMSLLNKLKYNQTLNFFLKFNRATKKQRVKDEETLAMFSEKNYWHIASDNNFIFPIKYIFCYKTTSFYNRGIDIQLNWNKSTLRICKKLAVNYIQTSNINDYNNFKAILNDWQLKNPYLKGVNWIDPVHTSIRATNIIFCLNIFRDLVVEDFKFYKTISRFLMQHLNYLLIFSQFSRGKYNSNHAIINLTAVLLIKLTVKSNKLLSKAINNARNNLEFCIQQQTNSDGSNFEGSIPYHFLANEVFSIAYVAGKLNDINFSTEFIEKLYKLSVFSYSSLINNNYINQIGDDAPEFLLDSNISENKYQELINLNNKIFENCFRTSSEQCFIDFANSQNFNTELKKKNLDDAILENSFHDFGLYILRNDYLNIQVSLLNKGQNGKGGHNHFDEGSICISTLQTPLFIDSGTGNYTKNINERNLFRSPFSHNTLINEQEVLPIDKKINFFKSNIWYMQEILNFDDNNIHIKLKNINNNIEKERIVLLRSKEISIIDFSKGNIYALFHLHPEINVEIVNNNARFYFNNSKIAELKTTGNIKIENCIISPKYDEFKSSKKITIKGENKLETKLFFE